MTTSPMDMRSTQMQMQDQRVQSQARDVGNLVKGGMGGGKSEAQKEAKLRESCEGFESIFIQKMWQQMRATLPKTNMLQGKEEQYWQSMYDQELAKSMAGAGGIGLADMMYEQLSRDLVSASRTTASAQPRGEGFAVNAAPLMGQTPQATSLGAQGNMGQALSQSTKLAATGRPASQGKHADMYSGSAPQPEAPGATAEGSAFATATAGAPATAETAQAQGEGAPVVQQFLAELRQRQAQQQAASPAQDGATAASGVTVAQHSSQHGPGGVSLAQRAQLDASNRPAANGVMPAVNQPQAQRSARLTAPPAPPATQPQGQQNMQAAFMPPPATAVQSATSAAAQVPHATITQAQAAMQSSAPVAAQAQAFTAQSTAPVAPEEQQPQVINTTFTTNIPPKNRRTPRPRGQRLPSGQPAIRTLAAPVPASPITTTGAPATTAGVPQVNPAQAAPMAPQAMSPQNMPQGAPASMQIEG